jgi:ABC-type sugar transport system permease subunit
MRYLSLLLLGPWLLVLAWAFWAWSKSFHITWPRRLYDMAVIALALIAATAFALNAYDGVAIQQVGGFGRESGGIWKQVMPALYGYGAFAAILIVAVLVRRALWQKKRHP